MIEPKVETSFLLLLWMIAQRDGPQPARNLASRMPGILQELFQRVPYRALAVEVSSTADLAPHGICARAVSLFRWEMLEKFETVAFRLY
jgi:hypothetical protein